MQRDFHEQFRPCRCRDRGLSVFARDLDWSERALHHTAKLMDTAWAARQMSYTEPMISRKTSRRVLVLEIVRAEILRAEVTDKERQGWRPTDLDSPKLRSCMVSEVGLHR